MSADQLHPEHIHVLIYTGLHPAPGTPRLSWGYLDSDGNRRSETLNSTNADRVGQMLVDANTASVNHLYHQDDAYIYSYRRPKHTNWSTIELLQAIRGYQYQACETPDWIGSPAWSYCQALTAQLIRDLPGYDEATTWQITPTSLPTDTPQAAATITDRQAMRALQNLMSGVESNADTFDSIAMIMKAAGYHLAEVE